MAYVTFERCKLDVAREELHTLLFALIHDMQRAPDGHSASIVCSSWVEEYYNPIYCLARSLAGPLGQIDLVEHTWGEAKRKADERNAEAKKKGPK